MKKEKQAYIQVRIDAKTKQEAKKVLEDIGMDTSTAVKILLKQVARSGVFPIILRDVNGLSVDKYQELKESSIDAKKSKKGFVSAKNLVKDLSL